MKAFNPLNHLHPETSIFTNSQIHIDNIDELVRERPHNRMVQHESAWLGDLVGACILANTKSNFRKTM